MPAGKAAMKFGIGKFVQKPVAADDLSGVTLSVVRNRRARRVPTDGAQADPELIAKDGRAPWPPLSGRPRSAAERWARHVLKACESEGDLKTLADWARCVGVSYSSVRESCRLLDIQPRDARDLVRVLRAIIKSRFDHCPPKVLLDVSDSRTLKTLTSRAGMGAGLRAGVTVEQFLKSQRFIARENEGLRVLQKLLIV